MVFVSLIKIRNKVASLVKSSLVMSMRHWYESRVEDRNFLGQLLRKLRRFYLGTFRPGYIEKAIEATREGDCHRCGLCCELIYKCPFLGRDGQNLPYCRVYGDLRPANCRNYPFDARDSEIDTCGYTFKPTGKVTQVPKVGLNENTVPQKTD